MADTTEEVPVTFDPSMKKKKKKVNFDAEEENGVGEKETAENHSLPEASEDAAAEEEADAFKGMKKKSKKKVSADGDDAATSAAAADGAEFDPTALKKKKKKKVVKKDAFDAKLEKAGVLPSGEAGAEEEQKEEDISVEDAGDPRLGTGVWHSSSNVTLTYPLLLNRFFDLLRTQHPDLAGEGRTRSYKIPPPQMLREGNKKTIFANLAEICKKMKRSEEHVIAFLFAELGTTGSVDGSRRLVIKGKFLQKQLENVLRRYIMEYVTCNTCKQPDTDLKKGENRLYFVTCNSCGSRRSVSAIKTGFQATVGKRRRQQV